MERARELIQELRALDMSRTELYGLGVRLDRLKRFRCIAVTLAGTQCVKMCDHPEGRCRVHSRERAPPPQPKPTCSEQTAQGETCKRSVFQHLDVCWRHGLQKGLVEPPSNECSICYEVITTKDKKKTSCGHVFHVSCLSKWFERSADYRPPCPMCRHPLRRPVSSVLILGTDWFLSTETPYMLAQDVPTFESA